MKGKGGGETGVDHSGQKHRSVRLKPQGAQAHYLFTIKPPLPPSILTVIF